MDEEQSFSGRWGGGWIRPPPAGGMEEAVNYIRRVSSRGGGMAREAGNDQLQGRQTEWAYAQPVVILDFVWNLAFLAMAALAVILRRHEQTRAPLRLWLLGYCLQCSVHMICVCSEYRLRQRGTIQAPHAVTLTTSTEINGGPDLEMGLAESEPSVRHASLTKRLECANTIFSFLWWIVGFYWTTSIGGTLSQDSPGLYWLCVVFLAFDVFFVVFCVTLACMIGVAVCCCLPCIIAVLYAVTDKEGASDEDINLLPKHTFQGGGCLNKTPEGQSPSPGGMIDKRTLSAEDAECCICLSGYEDGVELLELPCSHHFHSLCVDKWLRINATCPLCKYNIISKTRAERSHVAT